MNARNENIVSQKEGKIVYDNATINYKPGKHLSFEKISVTDLI